MRTIAISLSAATLAATTSFVVTDSLRAQSLDQRITRQEGTVRMSYTPREGVCGDGGATIYTWEPGSSRRTIHVRGNTYSNTIDDRFADEWEPNCVPGPVRVAITVEAGSITSLRTYVGGEWPSAGTRDLGRVTASDAARTLIRIAERAAGGRSANEILFAASMADSADTARDLLRLARSQDVGADVRKAAVYHLGNAAAEAATRGLHDIARDGDEAIGVRESAVFALTRQPSDVGVPALIDLVRNSTEPRVRKAAIFWLARSDDPRAIKLFEELLLSRPPRS